MQLRTYTGTLTHTSTHTLLTCFYTSASFGGTGLLKGIMYIEWDAVTNRARMGL